MPYCPQCARQCDRDDILCEICDGENAAAVVVHRTPGPDAAPSAGGAPPSPPQSAGALGGWKRWHVAAAIAAAAGGAALMVLVLRAGGSRQDSRSLVQEASFVVPARPASDRVSVTSDPKWSDADSGRWVGNSRHSVAFALPAENTVNAWVTRVRPVLVVRCLDNTTEAFVYTQVPAAIEPHDDTRTVYVRFDNDSEGGERWLGSADHDALFAPDGLLFAQRLGRARTLRFGFTPHNGPLATVEFDVRGFDAHVEKLARTCHWKTPLPRR